MRTSFGTLIAVVATAACALAGSTGSAAAYTIEVPYTGSAWILEEVRPLTATDLAENPRWRSLLTSRVAAVGLGRGTRTIGEEDAEEFSGISGHLQADLRVGATLILADLWGWVGDAQGVGGQLCLPLKRARWTVREWVHYEAEDGRLSRGPSECDVFALTEGFTGEFVALGVIKAPARPGVVPAFFFIGARSGEARVGVLTTEPIGTRRYVRFRSRPPATEDRGSRFGLGIGAGYVGSFYYTFPVRGLYVTMTVILSSVERPAGYYYNLEEDDSWGSLSLERRF